MTKKKATLVLAVLLLAVVTMQAVAMPSLHYFMGVGTVQSMVNTGYTIGKVIGQLFGSKTYEFAGFVLMLA